MRTPLIGILLLSLLFAMIVSISAQEMVDIPGYLNKDRVLADIDRVQIMVTTGISSERMTETMLKTPQYQDEIEKKLRKADLNLTDDFFSDLNSAAINIHISAQDFDDESDQPTEMFSYTILMTIEQHVLPVKNLDQFAHLTINNTSAMIPAVVWSDQKCGLISAKSFDQRIEKTLDHMIDSFLKDYNLAHQNFQAR